MNYKHFSIEEREKIQELLWQKASIRSIATALNRSPASVSREIKRNKPPERNRYSPRKAHMRALEHRTHRGRTKRLKNERIRTYVVKHLKRRWSPEQIAGRITLDLKENVSHEAIYQFIYDRIQKGTNVVKNDYEDLRPYLRRRRKIRLPHGARKCQRMLKPLGRSIDERPQIVLARKYVGDWEGDTVESKDHKPGVNTLVERKIGLVFITKLKDKSVESTVRVMAERFKYVPQKFKRSVTLDNGPENRDWQSIERRCSIDCFSAHPYSAWERPTNENTNGLIRQYYPKGYDFNLVSDSEIKRIQNLLNSRPRKCLGFKTPLQVERRLSRMLR